MAKNLPYVSVANSIWHNQRALVMYRQVLAIVLPNLKTWHMSGHSRRDRGTRIEYCMLEIQSHALMYVHETYMRLYVHLMRLTRNPLVSALAMERQTDHVYVTY